MSFMIITNIFIITAGTRVSAKIYCRRRRFDAVPVYLLARPFSANADELSPARRLAL